MTCPECALGLALVEGEDVALFACAQCGGAWIDAQASMAILQGKTDPSAVQRRSKPPSPRAGPERTRPCARCAEAMLPYPFGDVMLDTCPAHGTWFDHEEIERVVKVARGMAKKTTAIALPSGDDVWATARFAVGMIVLPLEALANALAAVITSTRRDRDRDPYDY
jgi:Zn-finger nucleic acid-binding protein